MPGAARGLYLLVVAPRIINGEKKLTKWRIEIKGQRFAIGFSCRFVS